MKIENILKEFVKESVSNLNLKSIVQFGSSTYSKNFDDIDLVFVFNDDVIKTTDILKLRELIKKFEKKYKEIVFDFSISVIVIGFSENFLIVIVLPFVVIGNKVALTLSPVSR